MASMAASVAMEGSTGAITEDGMAVMEATMAGTATTVVAMDITTVAVDTGTADGILTGSALVGDVIRIRVLGYGPAIDRA